MARAITIRDVPDEAADALAARAAASGRSLQEYLRSRLIDLATKPDAESWVANVQAMKDTYGINVPIDVILAARDEDRR